MAKKQKQQEQQKKVYTTSVPLKMHIAVQGSDVEEARNEVYKAVAAMQLIMRMQVQLLDKPSMEEFDMKAANKAAQEVEVEVDGE